MVRKRKNLTRKRRTRSRKFMKGGAHFTNDMKIFIVHYKKLLDRKKRIIEQLEKYKLTNYEFVEIDRDELNKYDTTIFDNTLFNVYKAINLSHIHCYREIADKYEFGLILEDDAILDENFTEKLSKYLRQLPKDYDMLFIGGHPTLRIEDSKTIPEIHVYEKGHEMTDWGGHGATRTTASYIVSKQCAVKLMKYIQNSNHKISKQIDFWLNDVLKDGAFKVYWGEPSIVEQGSNTGKTKTSYEMKGGSDKKESVLIILSTNEMYPEFKPQVETLKKYIEHLSKTYTVDIAGISSKDDFSNYSGILDFKYKYINSKLQVAKICDFITENKDTLNYDWFLRTRPEEELLDFDTIDFKNLPKDAVSARAREYAGPFTGKYSCSVGGEGSFKDTKACLYKPTLEKIILNSDIYVFHKTAIDKGGFSKLTKEEENWGTQNDKVSQSEWFFSHTMTSRGIKLNIIGINTKFTRKSRNQFMYSGNIKNIP
jgi:GR25 family glycosyltransferase involved in LPS biosynthesis